MRVYTIESEGVERKVEIEKVGDTLVLWQNNDQPSNDAVWLTPATARQLRDILNKLEL